MNTKPAKVCRHSILIGCQYKEDPSFSMCLACLLAYLAEDLNRERFAEAGAHLDILARILAQGKFVTEADFRAVFETKTKEDRREYMQ